MSNLPGEITDDILLVSHAKSICRFRCVCKNWCSLFNNDKFIERRLKHSIQSEKLNCFSIKDYDNGHEFYMHITKFSSVFEGGHCESVKMDSPFKDESLKIEIVGSYNGLILMSCSKYYLGTRHWLWNPCTKELKGIVDPTIKHRLLDYRSTAYGIGYNRDTDDYTIMLATSYADAYWIGYVYDIQIYTSKSESWKTLNGTFLYGITSMDGKAETIFVFGAFHWIGRRLHSSRLGIVSFDIHGENFNEVAVTPLVSDILHYINYNHHALGVLGGCLCIVRTYGYIVDVWVKKDYNVTESWTKYFTVQLPELEKSINYVKLLWEFKNGEVLFVTTTESKHENRLVLYDPVSKKSEVTIIQHTARDKWNIEAYAERSLERRNLLGYSAKSKRSRTCCTHQESRKSVRYGE